MKLQPMFYKLHIPQHVFFILGILLIIFNYASPWWLIAPFIAYIFMGYLGGAIFIHRYWCHDSFKTNKWIARFFTYLGAMSGMGSPLAMCAVHMYLHHPYSDTEKDPHTPKFEGTLHSWITWKNIEPGTFSNAFSMLLRSRKAIMRDKFNIHLHRHFYKYWWATLSILLIIDWRIALFGFAGGGVYSTHIEGFVNSQCHNKAKGYRIDDTKDDSVNHNSKLMMFLSLGNTLHHNHHVYPSAWSYRLKKGEFDLAHWIEPILSTRS